MKLTLRPLRDEDEELLLRIYVSSLAEELLLVPWSEEQKAAFLRQQFAAQHMHFTRNYPGASLDIVLVDEAAAGRLYVHRGERELRIMDLALLPEYRGRGIGGRLLAPLVAEADESGKRASIHVEQGNPAIRLYERLGFRRADVVGIHFLLQREPREKAAS